MHDPIFVDGKELNPDTIKLVRRCHAAANAASAFNKAFDKYWNSLPLLMPEDFWPILYQYRAMILLYRFQYNRTNGVEVGAMEFMRKAWAGEREYKLNTAIKFAKTYPHMCKKLEEFLPKEYRKGLLESAPLGGEHIGKDGQYKSIDDYRAAVTMSVAEMNELDHVAERMVKLIISGDVHTTGTYAKHLHDASRYYLAAALKGVECPSPDQDRFVTIDVDRETLATVLDKTDGPMTVQAKLDDEGLVLDVYDSEGEVIDSAWLLYAEACVKVTPEEE